MSDFHCKKCKCQRPIEVIQDSCAVASLVVIDDNAVNYIDHRILEGYEIRYQCQACGTEIRDSDNNLITDSSNLIEYLEDQKETIKVKKAKAFNAIRARINNEWDNEDLIKYGAIEHDMLATIKKIIGSIK